jgi:Protein of unknown function (DUF1598)
MRWRGLIQASFLLSLAGALITAAPAGMMKKSWSQANPGGVLPGQAGQGQAGQGGQLRPGQGGSTTTNNTFIAGNQSGANGIIINPDGVLQSHVFLDPTGELSRDRIKAARAKMDQQLAKASKLRKVSLNRLEVAAKANLDKQLPLTDEMLHLAGLTRVQYVFYYPDTKDIVLAGPAEGWATDAAGHAIGFDSGHTVLELDDLIVALRAFPPAGKQTPVILCSIDPTPEGLERMQGFLKSIGQNLSSPDDAEFIVDGLRTSLGFQNIRVQGIAPNTHFAHVLIEADYRMKLIGIGLEKPAVRLASYVDKANPGAVSRNSLQRWYFIPDYQCVRVSADRLGMQLVGNGVKLVDEDQLVSTDGSRKSSGRSNKASKAFVTGFTQKYPELASRTPVYAQLRNCIDLAISAAFIQQQDYYGKAGWRMETFADESAVPVETLNTPARTETVVTSVWKGTQLMTPVGGGVTIQPTKALQTSNTLPDEDGAIGQLRESVNLKELAADRWWWD